MTKKVWHKYADYASGGAVATAALLLYGVVDLFEKIVTRLGVDLSTFATSPHGLILHSVLLLVLYGVLKLHAAWYREAIEYLYRKDLEDQYEEHG